jgi:2-amino-4-hydroxy-6-hydroxymethyldihydropteridine diphosphokinase
VERAVDRLGQQVDVSVISSSPWYETASVGSAETCFINGVIEVATSLQPTELLDVLQQIEHELGRVSGDRWGSRAIDLDLLAQGEFEYHDKRLDVPHPAAWYRRFVLDPWEQIAADWVVPRWEMTVADLRRRLLQRPLPIRLIGGTREERQEIADASTEEFRGSVTLTSVHVEGDVNPLRMTLGYLPEAISTDDDRWFVNLSQLASELSRSIAEVARFVLTAALDEPRIVSDTDPGEASK